MGDLLFLSQRLPYPPNKGDKIRSWNIFRHFAQRHRMHLGCFIDDPADWPEVPEIAKHCASSLILPLNPTLAKLRSFEGFLTGNALTLPYFRRRAMSAWVADTMRRHRPSLVFVYSSSMAQYILPLPRNGARLVLDMVDMDSQKWQQYAGRKTWPASWVFHRESRKLHRFERDIAAHFDRTLFVSPAEAELFRLLTPGIEDRVDFVNNGVDLDYFAPTAALPSPFEAGVAPVVFTGTMDYWPNVDAVTWFADAIWPGVLAQNPSARFAIVGANPAPGVRELAGRPGIRVTGRVPDVRPYIAHAALVVAPLRVAQGVQNKILEAMSMARPVIATPQAVEGIEAQSGRDLVIAETPAAFVSVVVELLARRDNTLGTAARAFVEKHYGWADNLRRLSMLCGEPAETGPVDVKATPLTVAERSVS